MGIHGVARLSFKMRFSQLAYLLRYPKLDIQLFALDLAPVDSIQSKYFYHHHEMKTKYAGLDLALTTEAPETRHTCA